MFGPHNGRFFHTSNSGYEKPRFLEERMRNAIREHVVCLGITAPAWVNDVATNNDLGIAAPNM
jgi:hypothetical protein